MTRPRNRRLTHDLVQPIEHWNDIIGRTFGRLYVIGFTGVSTKHKQRMVTCRCACGFYVDVMKTALTSRNTSSCGCAHSEQLASRNVASTKHGATSNATQSSLYRAWSAIKTRCFNERCEAYPDYGGRGITMHVPWVTSFTQFNEYVERELGPRPSRLYSLDRKDNDGNYAPGNLRWATPTQQVRNQRKTRLYALNGETRSLGDWADLAGQKVELVTSRVIRYGWPLDEALGTPPGFGRCPLKDRVKWTSTDSYKR